MARLSLPGSRQLWGDFLRASLSRDPAPSAQPGARVNRYLPTLVTTGEGDERIGPWHR
ncbi:MAG TPA: hypothetical protein VGI91_11165 [Steroidobacteraceae bacterium]